MSTKEWSVKQAWLCSGLLLLMIVALFFNSCSGNYETPSTTQTPTALITPATLKAWTDAGLVNGTGFDRVIILDISPSATYTTGHITGAYLLDPSDSLNPLTRSRSEGIAISSNEVPSGPNMDALIQKYGITGNTTIVFTGSSIMNASRGYYTFRYWGFPKNRLKLLDGLNGTLTAIGTWRNLYGSLFTTEAPTSAAVSTYSVRNNRRLRNDLRVSLSEMIDYADGKVPNAVAVDDRTIDTLGSYAGVRGSTLGLYLPGTGNTTATNDSVVFEGRIRGAKALRYDTLYDTTAAGLNLFKTSQLQNLVNAIGIDSTKTTYVYCRQGMLATILFFALDGYLGWPVAVYDGSWSQWGQLSGDASKKGQLAADSPWRTDILGRSESVAYNFAFFTVEQFTADGSATTGCSATYDTAGAVIADSFGGTTECTNLPDAFDDGANSIEKEDMDYMNSGSGGTGGGGGGGGC